MTRKRTRESLEKLLTDNCPRCEGRRVVKSVPTLAAEVLRGIQREAVSKSAGDMLIVKLNRKSRATCTIMARRISRHLSSGCQRR